jgi:hypothetical protein
MKIKSFKDSEAFSELPSFTRYDVTRVAKTRREETTLALAFAADEFQFLDEFAHYVAGEADSVRTPDYARWFQFLGGAFDDYEQLAVGINGVQDSPKLDHVEINDVFRVRQAVGRDQTPVLSHVLVELFRQLVVNPAKTSFRVRVGFEYVFDDGAFPATRIDDA